MKAILEIQNWINENQEETISLVASKASILAEQVKANLDSNNLLLDFGNESIEHLNSIKNWGIETGNFKEDFEITDFVDTTALENIKSSKEN